MKNIKIDPNTFRPINNKKKINTRVLEVIDYIEGLLTPEQLKNLEITYSKGICSFRDRMIDRYGSWRLMYSWEETKRKIEQILKTHEPIIVANTKLNCIFLDKFEGTIFIYF